PGPDGSWIPRHRTLGPDPAETQTPCYEPLPIILSAVLPPALRHLLVRGKWANCTVSVIMGITVIDFKQNHSLRVRITNHIHSCATRPRLIFTIAGVEKRVATARRNSPIEAQYRREPPAKFCLPASGSP